MRTWTQATRPKWGLLVGYGVEGYKASQNLKSPNIKYFGILGAKKLSLILEFPQIGK